MSAEDRELLRFAKEEWSALPPDLLKEPRPAEDRRRIAEAAFRRLLAVRSIDRWGEPNAAPPLTRLRLSSGEILDLTVSSAARSGSTIEGVSLRGLPIELPLTAVRQREKLSDAETLSTWQGEIRRRVTLLTEGTDPYEWTSAIELLLARDQKETAERYFATWVEQGGPQIAIDRALPQLTEDQLLELATVWSEEPRADRVLSNPRQADAPNAPRSLTSLHTFLADRQLRGLNEEERLEKITECEAWEAWLERQGGALSLSEGERASLAQRLQVLRYDLLKTSGF